MRKAFTLIEMLVVVAVIAVLAALLIPVFVKARERAKATQCINNLHQIGGAFGLYLADYDDRYPWAWRNYWVAHGRKPSVQEVLKPYTASNALWICPSDIGETFPEDPTGWRSRTKPAYMLRPSSYEWAGLGMPNLYLAGCPTSEVKRPDLGWLAGEARPWHGHYDPRAPDLTKDPALYNVLHTDFHIGRESYAQWYGSARSAFTP